MSLESTSGSSTLNWGRGLIVLAAVMWSTSGFFAKAPLFADWPIETRGTLLAFWRALFAGLLILPFVRRPRWSLWLLPMGLCFAAMNVTYLRSMTLTTAANAIWLQCTAPWWVFLFTILLRQDLINRRDLIPLGFGMLGVGTILYHELRGQAPAGILYGLASAVFYAAVVMLLRQLRDQNAPWLVAVNHLITAGLIAPYAVLYGPMPSTQQMLVLVAFGLFQMALPYVLFARGLRSVTGQEATAIGLVEPVLVPVWVYLAWGEEPRWWTMVGAACILVGLTLRYVVPLILKGQTSQGRS